MATVEEYRRTLRELAEWEPSLLERSGLSGPRANLELAAAVAEEAGEASLRRWAALGPTEAPFGSAAEFLSVCGVADFAALLGENAALGSGNGARAAGRGRRPLPRLLAEPGRVQCRVVRVG